MDIDNTQEQRLKNQTLLRLLTCATASITVLSALPLVGFHPFIIISLSVLLIYIGVSKKGKRAAQNNIIYRCRYYRLGRYCYVC